jgi:outer membrane protein TolC
MAIKYYPRKAIFDANELKAKSDAQTTKASVFDIFNAAYIYRPDNKTTINALNPYNINGFQFGVTVSLGSLLSKPSAIQSANATYTAAKAQSADYLISLKTEVRTRYYDYLLKKSNLLLRNQSSQELKVTLTDVKLKYERSQIPVDVYTTVKNTAFEADELLLNAEAGYLIAKNALEDLIGNKLENIK